MYNYKITFNEDITFLHGKNGCGKTTILNIITYIITGRIYKLLPYDFESIILTYKEKRKNKKISVIKEKEDIRVIFEDTEVLVENSVIEKIEREIKSESPLFRIETRMSSMIDEECFKEYPILQKIKELFDFVYIPLNRNDLEERGRYTYRRYRERQSTEPIYNSANTILDNYARIKSRISGLGKTLQINIIKAMYQYNMHDYMKNEVIPEKSAVKKDIDNFKKADLYDEELEKLIRSFYEQLIESKDRDVNIFYFSKIAQINKIREVFNKYDEEVKKLNEPIDKLEKLVNRFFEDSAEKKRIVIEENEIYFLTEHDKRKVGLDNLSSGEKQILILFTYLIFNIANKANPICIIDEPELSLHLLWQKNFVKSVLETNPDMQLILATHAPEIIEEFRDKTYKVKLDI